MRKSTTALDLSYSFELPTGLAISIIMDVVSSAPGTQKAYIFGSTLPGSRLKGVSQDAMSIRVKNIYMNLCIFVRI